MPGNGDCSTDVPNIKSPQALNVLTANIRGIECYGRLDQIRILLVKHNVSVAVLTETETSHTVAETTNIEGFKAFCPPASVTGPSGKEVGVTMLISNELTSVSKPRPDINCNDTIQTVWVELMNHNILIGGVYRRARPSAELESDEFTQLSNQILKAASTGKKVLVLGDNNIDHSNPNHKKSKEAKDLLSHLEAANMRRLPSTVPTWQSYGLHKVCSCPTNMQESNPSHSLGKGHAACGCPKRHLSSVIDNAYLSISETADLQVLKDAISDHFPILVSLATKLESKVKTKTIYRRDFSRLLTSDLEDVLMSKDWSPLYNIRDPNEAVTFVLNHVTEALDTVAPLKPIKIRPDKPNISLKRDTLAMMASRDNARRNGNRGQFKRLRNSAIKLIKRDRIQGVLNRLKKNPGPQSAWREAKIALGRGRVSNLPECTTNNNPEFTAEHQNKFFVNKIAKLVASLPTPKVHEGKKPFKCNGWEKVHEEGNVHDEGNVHEGGTKSFSFKFVNAGTVTRIVKGLKNTKASGVDELPTEVWKKAITIVAGPIAYICNLSLSTGAFPDIFKQAIIHPVYKGNGKDPRDPGSYRPISILPSLSKILEIIVRDALLDWLGSHKLIPDSQFGFLPGRSATMALACAQNDWIDAKSKGNSVGVMAFDLSAAFDTISPITLLSKLESYGMTGVPLKWFKSYMSGRSQKVLWNDLMSEPCPLTHGVPQGSILGPTLFLVMIADMPKHVIGNMSNANMMSYADDSTFYVHAKNLGQLKADLEILSDRMISYCHSAGLVLNNDKTQLLVSPKQECHIRVGSSQIASTTEINLLGVDFDSNFSTKPFLNNLARAAKSRAALIHRLSFVMPPHLLTSFAHGILMGKILNACPVTIPIRLHDDDRMCIGVTEEINKAIKATARTITKTKLSDKIRSEDILRKANLKCLNEAVASITAVTVWKSKQSMNPLGLRLFKEHHRSRSTRSTASNEIRPPVPGYPMLATNIMASVWNDIPELQSASTLAAAKTAASKWSKGLPKTT